MGDQNARSNVRTAAAGEGWEQELTGPAAQRSFLEIGVFPGRLEVYEHYGDQATEALAAALARYGVRVTKRYSSPCG
ncbi:MAG: hypothetical protein WD535_03240 [Thermaerobacterales bacterium]